MKHTGSHTLTSAMNIPQTMDDLHQMLRQLNQLSSKTRRTTWL